MLPTARVIELPYQAGTSSSSKEKRNSSSIDQADDEARRAAFTARASHYDFSPISVDAERAGKAFLTTAKWTSGLQANILHSIKKIPLRFIVVDDRLVNLTLNCLLLTCFLPRSDVIAPICCVVSFILQILLPRATHLAVFCCVLLLQLRSAAF
jgi:hypothetical protein